MAEQFPKLAQDLVDAWNSHDAERILALFADEFVYEDVTFGVVSRTRAELSQFFVEAFGAVPDIHFELTSAVVGGESGAAEWTMSGTHTGDFPGMPATNKRFSVRGASVFELAGGKLRANRDYWDSATMLRQVGLMPEAATA